MAPSKIAKLNKKMDESVFAVFRVNYTQKKQDINNKRQKLPNLMKYVAS